MEIATTSSPQDHCCLVHRVFAMFGDPLFRRAESDGAPVMAVHLGEKQAAIPLGALQREFGIEDGSDDGRMLGLIAQALDFVAGLRIGDPLPPEVLSGQASWEPDAVHLQIANARLQWQLVTWLNSGTGADAEHLDAESLLQVADDPARRQQVQQAFAKAAEVLGLPDRAAVIGLVEELARELAYIEALRDRLLRRAKVMAEKLNRIAKAFRGRRLASRDADAGASAGGDGPEADEPPLRRTGRPDRRGDVGTAQRRQPTHVHPVES